MADPLNTRGYFGIGVENVSKPMNAGNLLRTAHAFGAGFFFFLGAGGDMAGRLRAGTDGVSLADALDPGGTASLLRQVERSDTTHARRHMPVYVYADVAGLVLPVDCPLIAVELVEDAQDLPRVLHPPQAAYVLGPERGTLSDAALARAAACVRLPTRFCLNLGIAGALVLYDRLLSLGEPRTTRRPLIQAGRAGRRS